jgi:hypothetical protein
MYCCCSVKSRCLFVFEFYRNRFDDGEWGGGGAKDKQTKSKGIYIKRYHLQKCFCSLTQIKKRSVSSIF